MTGHGRWRFLQLGVGGAAAAGITWSAAGGANGAAAGAGATKLPEGKMPMRKLGRTGVDVSLLGLGGFHIGTPTDDQTAIRIVRTAIDHGVNFMDNCWDYHEGRSHAWMGKALRDGYRQKRVPDDEDRRAHRKSAAAQIDQSLKGLGTDVIDLIQIHEVIRADDPERVFGPGRRDRGADRGEARRGRSASSASRVTRARPSTSRCWRSPPRTASRSTPCRCRST